MTLVFVSVFDKAIMAYMRPFAAQSIGQALRLFEDEVTRSESEVGKHPEDYSLFHVANFDDTNGHFESVEPICLRRAHEISVELKGVG